MHRMILPVAVLAAVTLSWFENVARADSPFGLVLPEHAVSDRVSITRGIGADRRETWMELEGPGCIKHIWITLKHPKHSDMVNRKIVMRIYFDDAKVPHVEAPVGDFFGVMHGLGWYDVNDHRPIDMGRHEFFREKTVMVELREGRNFVIVKLSDTRGSNHGGWAFAFEAVGPDGEILVPSVEE